MDFENYAQKDILLENMQIARWRQKLERCWRRATTDCPQSPAAAHSCDAEQRGIREAEGVHRMQVPCTGDHRCCI